MAVTPPGIDEALVRRRAFELWQARGCPMGSPEDDWFTAVRSLETTPPVSTAPRSPAAVDVDRTLEVHAPYSDAADRLPLGLRLAT